MSRYSKDKILELHAQMRRLMAMFPNISARRIADELHLDHGFACREKRKIERENIERVKRTTVERELAGIQQFVDEMLPEIAHIITDPGVNAAQRISAFKAVVTARAVSFDRKFNAAVFAKAKENEKRELSPEQEAAMLRAVQDVMHVMRQPYDSQEVRNGGRRKSSATT